MMPAVPRAVRAVCPDAAGGLRENPARPTELTDFRRTANLRAQSGKARRKGAAVGAVGVGAAMASSCE
jgi:hypothetical protein